MAYVRNEWKENDIITAEKLNNLEEGCDDIFDLGVVDITLPTEEDPAVIVKGNLIDDQIEKLRNCDRVKLSIVEEASNISVTSCMLFPIIGKVIYDGSDGEMSFNNETLNLASFLYNGTFLYKLQFDLSNKSYNFSIKYSNLN